jgi:hypothetical protein
MSPAGDQRAEAQFERTLNVTGPVEMEVSMRCGRVRLRGGEPGVVSIRGVARAQPSIFTWIHPDDDISYLAADPPIEQDGNAIRIGDFSSRWRLRRVSLILDVTVPFETSLRAMMDAADVRVDGIRGPVDCETDSGEVEITGVTERVSASTDSGSVSIRGVKGPVDAETDSGEIEALEIGGGIDAHSDSGRIRLSQTAPAPVYVQTDSGRISIKLAPAGYTIRIRTDSGEIEVPQMDRVRTSSHEVEGSIRGGGSIVAIETDSGAIEIE